MNVSIRVGFLLEETKKKWKIPIEKKTNALNENILTIIKGLNSKNGI